MESAIFISIEASIGMDHAGELHLQDLIRAAFGFDAYLTLVPGGRLFTKGKPDLSEEDLASRYPDYRNLPNPFDAFARAQERGV